MNISGTVQYVNLEGGFWGIISSSGKQFLPVNLPTSRQVHGAVIHCKYRLANDIDSFIQWGELIQIISFDSQ